MRAVLIDTDVFSFIFKRDSRAVPYQPHLKSAQACVCFQTVAELRLWALIRRWGEPRRQNLDASLARCLVLPYDDATARSWAELTAHRRRAGQPIACGDAWIAATAVRHNLPLLTYNTADFVDIPGLQVVCYSDSQSGT